MEKNLPSPLNTKNQPCLIPPDPPSLPSSPAKAGRGMSIRSLSDEFGKIFVTPNLRCVQAFLDDALRFARNSKKSGPNSSKWKKVAISSINHAFALNSLMSIPLEEVDIQCLEEFNIMRQKFINELMSTDKTATLMSKNPMNDDGTFVLPMYMYRSEEEKPSS